MLSAKDVAIVYETLLSSPGMSDNVKISFSIPRKNVLLLTRVIEAGLSVKEENGLLAEVNSEVRDELKEVIKDFLRKAGLTETNDRLNSLLVKEK